jgi:hypothetical protein
MPDITSFPPQQSSLPEEIIQSNAHPDISYSLWICNSNQAAHPEAVPKYYYKGKRIGLVLWGNTPTPFVRAPKVWGIQRQHNWEKQRRFAMAGAEFTLKQILRGDPPPLHAAERGELIRAGVIPALPTD